MSATDVPRRVAPVVLVVDDDDYVADTVTAALRSVKPEIVRAATAGDGLRLALERRPDIAIVDLGLPDADGYTLTRRIRTFSELAEMRICILTGYLPDDVAARDAGADAVLGKPFKLREFLATIETLRGPVEGT
jgi:two-component system KDP operon response regulator KdpE